MHWVCKSELTYAVVGPSPQAKISLLLRTTDWLLVNVPRVPHPIFDSPKLFESVSVTTLDAPHTPPIPVSLWLQIWWLRRQAAALRVSRDL
jgi:hypothetical protein